MITNDNFEDDLTGFLFSMLYLIRDAEENGLHNTSKSLVLTLDAFLSDCAKDADRAEEFKKIISVCMASMNLYENELDQLITEIQKVSGLKN